ncbi:MAG: SDR family NAD(P)-dependent oxidoreductase [Planctomycetota bacterium]|nr:SDR family NAD(P)-dependent oxidoreductase [Planctomycetota bacterium]
MSTPLSQARILITGAAGGIGSACARAFAKAGARVAMTDVAAPPTPILEGGQHRFIPADLRSEASIRDLVAQAAREMGGLDVLVNNAAVLVPTVPLHETALAQFDDLVAVNLRAVFLLCREAYPHLKASRGCIVNMSSMAGVNGEKHHALYAATKGAVNALTQSMAVDYGGDGIRCNAVCPSSVITPNVDKMIAATPDPAATVKLRRSINPLGFTALPEHIASVVLFLASPEAAFMSGALVPVSGGSECGYGIKF